MQCGLENKKVRVVVVCDGSVGSAVFALYGGARGGWADFESPDASAEALSDTAVLEVVGLHGGNYVWCK